MEEIDQQKTAYQLAVADLDKKRELLAAEFQPHFNEYAKSLPQATYKEKQTTIKLLNAELRCRGFALKCPNTGIPSYLLLDTGDYPTIGRFQFAHPEEGESKSKVTASRNNLPLLEVILMDTTQKITKLDAETWAEKKGTRSNRGSNKRG